MKAKVENKKSKDAVKGLSIASTCLSSLSIFIALAGIFYVLLAFGLVHLGDAALDIAGKAQLGYNTSIDNENLIIGESVNRIIDLFNFGLGIMLAFTLFSLLTSCFSLAISIVNLSSLDKTKFPQSLFPLNVINAILSFISINLVRCVVITILSVFIYKIKD